MPKEIIERTDKSFYDLAHEIADEIEAAAEEEFEDPSRAFRDVEEALEFSKTLDDLVGTVEDLLYEKGLLKFTPSYEVAPELEEIIGGEEGEEGEREDED